MGPHGTEQTLLAMTFKDVVAPKRAVGFIVRVA